MSAHLMFLGIEGMIVQGLLHPTINVQENGDPSSDRPKPAPPSLLLPPNDYLADHEARVDIEPGLCCDRPIAN